MPKPFRGTIYNWIEVKCVAGSYILGSIRLEPDDHRFPGVTGGSISSIRTSLVVNREVDGTSKDIIRVETLNSIYNLGEPHGG